MKTILITGGGRGLARATAENLAALGHKVLLTARDAAAGAAAVAEIRAAHPKAAVEARALDLSSLKAVRAFGEGLAAEGLALDVLFNSAGVMQQSPERRLSADGFEETLAVNVLAPFLLTATLTPALRRSAEARIVNVSSRMHLPGGRGKPVDYDFDDPFLTRGYNPDRAYKNSKLAMLWFTYELQRRLGSAALTVNAVCPGFVPTTVAATSKGVMKFMLKYVLPHMSFANTVEQAVDSFTFMAVDPSLQGKGGGFYADQKPFESSPESHDEAKAKRFWDFAAATVGLAPA
jgi:retinol dehydrogenase-12